MDNYDSIFAGRVIANTVTVIAFIGIVVALAAYLSHKKGSIVPVIELGEEKKTKFSESAVLDFHGCDICCYNVHFLEGE